MAATSQRPGPGRAKCLACHGRGAVVAVVAVVAVADAEVTGALGKHGGRVARNTHIDFRAGAKEMTPFACQRSPIADEPLPHPPS